MQNSSHNYLLCGAFGDWSMLLFTHSFAQHQTLWRSTFAFMQNADLAKLVVYACNFGRLAGLLLNGVIFLSEV